MTGFGKPYCGDAIVGKRVSGLTELEQELLRALEMVAAWVNCPENNRQPSPKFLEVLAAIEKARSQS
jgi:hypothetical protein